MTRALCALFLVLLSGCSRGPSYSSVFTQYPYLRIPVYVFVPKFAHHPQDDAVKGAVSYIEHRVGCGVLFVLTDKMENADIVVEDHQLFVKSIPILPLLVEKGGVKSVLAKAQVRPSTRSSTTYAIMVYGQTTPERQVRLYVHEILHVLKVGHDDVNNSVMNPFLASSPEGSHIPDRTITRLRIRYCQ